MLRRRSISRKKSNSSTGLVLHRTHNFSVSIFQENPPFYISTDSPNDVNSRPSSRKVSESGVSDSTCRFRLLSDSDQERCIESEWSGNRTSKRNSINNSYEDESRVRSSSLLEEDDIVDRRERSESLPKNPPSFSSRHSFILLPEKTREPKEITEKKQIVILLQQACKRYSKGRWPSQQSLRLIQFIQSRKINCCDQTAYWSEIEEAIKARAQPPAPPKSRLLDCMRQAIYSNKNSEIKLERFEKIFQIEYHPSCCFGQGSYQVERQEDREGSKKTIY